MKVKGDLRRLFFDPFWSLPTHIKKKKTDENGTWGCWRRLTLQQGRCRGYGLRDSVHAVDGLEELRDTIILVRYEHLNLITDTGREHAVRKEKHLCLLETFKWSAKMEVFKNRRVWRMWVPQCVCVFDRVLSCPPSYKLPVTTLCKVWSDSWVIILK